MRRRLISLRTKLVLSTAYILLVVLVALEIPLALSVQHRSVSEFGSIQLGYAGLLSSRIADELARASALVAEPPHPGQSMTSAIEEVERARPDVRILVIDAHRRVLYDSSKEFPVDTVLDVSGRPELAAALRGEVTSVQRYSSSLGSDLLLVAVPVHEGRSLVGAIRLSEPLSEVRSSVRRTWLGLAGVGVAALLIGLIVELILANSLARPVRRLEEAAQRLKAGDLEARATPDGARELHWLARSFNEMADTLSTNLQAQRDFVAHASHQLQTPLTGLRLRLEAIQRGRGDPAEQAAKAQVEADRLGSLVRDLLTLASASSVERTGRRIDLREACLHAVDRWTDAAHKAGIRLALRSDGPVWVLADSADIAQVLDNLLDNAIRYCPQGTAVTLETESRADARTVIVSDDGPGIPPEERAKVFERFYRGGIGQRLRPGTGLGLPIVRELVHRWGGEIHLADGRGSTGARFEISFPPAAADS